MQFPPYLGHEYHLSDVSLRLPGSFGWSIGCLRFLFLFHHLFMLLFALIFAFTFDFMFVCWFSLTMLLTWIFFFLRLHNHFIFGRLKNLILDLLLKIEEAILDFIISLSFAILHWFFFTRTLRSPGDTAIVAKTWIDSNADIAGQTWAFRIIRIWIKCLGHIELFLIHWIKLKTWCWNWFEGLWVE